MAQQNVSPQSRFLVFGTVSFYMVAALAMVMANKWVLNATSVPLFFLLTQLVIAVVLFIFSHVVGLLKLPFRLNLELCKGLAPMLTLNVIGLSFSNFTLKYVDASFYQVARGLVLPFTVLTSYIFLSARPSLYVLFACGIVTCGFFIGVFLDGLNVSTKGVLFGVVSSATTALHAVVIKKAIKLLNDSALDLCWYTNLLSAVLLSVVVVISGEVPGIIELLYGDSDVLKTLIWGSLITGMLGFLMGIASLLSIKITSPITHMVSSAVRGVAGSFLAVLFFQDIITSGRAASIAIILGGSVYYTWVKHVESQGTPLKTEKNAYEHIPLDKIEAGKADKPE
ncbi:hypothetical protein EW145_g5284 [Phellinidium pouzarii]|uniref:Sugar phosphate transporter domain-containing protein n=1 Tax=Phellinidium pouzarii TaxID=167371 RepID=A0A4V3XC73_9AGAM|nr:hypothetical protein EW145_g5284 [Phellinidium pouzarii]